MRGGTTYGATDELGLYAVKLSLGYDIESEVKVLVVKPQEAPAAKR